MKHQTVSLALLTCALALSACSNSPSGSSAQAAEPTATTSKPAPERAAPLIARDPSRNAAPLGLEIGYANVEGVRSKLKDLTDLTDAGSNEYSRGRMLRSDGSDLGIEGLKSALFIFNDADTLEGVVLTLPRGPQYRGATADLAKTLGSKYDLVSKRFTSFMDYGTFRFEQGDSWVDIDSPHLSFEMSVTYATKNLFTAYAEAQAQSTQTAKEQKEALL